MKTKIIFSLLIALICAQYNTVKAISFDRPLINGNEPLGSENCESYPKRYDEVSSLLNQINILLEICQQDQFLYNELYQFLYNELSQIKEQLLEELDNLKYKIDGECYGLLIFTIE